MKPKRLRAAMESGVLNARCRNREQMLRAHGLWCWRMGLPMVWFEPRSPHSRLNRVHLDLFTTPGLLSLRGRAALIVLSARYVSARHASVTPSAAVWDRLGRADAEELARAVFRLVRRGGNHELTAQPGEPAAEPAIEPVAEPAPMPNVVPFPVERPA